MIIQCTRKFARRFAIDLPIDRDDTSNDAGVPEWYANVFEFRPLPNVLFMEARTLVSLVLPDDRRDSVGACFDVFYREAVLYFDFRGWGKITSLLVGRKRDESTYRKTANRRVVGSMTDFIRQARWAPAERPYSLIEVNDAMNENPMSYLGMDSPEGRVEKLRLRK